MNKEKLLKEFEEKFEETKKDLGFKAEFKELDQFFFLKDAILKDGFVGEILSRQICYRIVETYAWWNEYLHGLIMPGSQNILNMSESNIFDQKEKTEIVETMKKVMEIVSRNSLIGLTRDKKEESKFIDNSLQYWKEEFKEKMVKMMTKINKEWGKIK